MTTKAQRITALISDRRSPFTDADRDLLNALSDDHLATLASQDRPSRIRALIAGSITSAVPAPPDVLRALQDQRPAATVDREPTQLDRATDALVALQRHDAVVGEVPAPPDMFAAVRAARS